MGDREDEFSRQTRIEHNAFRRWLAYFPQGTPEGFVAWRVSGRPLPAGPPPHRLPHTVPALPFMYVAGTRPAERNLRIEFLDGADSQ